jgi:hypothetical protein
MNFGRPLPPKLVTACRRTGLRHRLRHAHQASIEFRLAEEAWQLDLLDIGAGGVCFGLRDGRPPLAPGTEIAGAVVRIGGAAVRGSLAIAHATEEFGAGTICGARFTPEGPADRQTLADVIRSLAS